MLWIVGVMLIAGLVGGAAGHLNTQSAPSGDAPPAGPPWKADVLIGLVAALCVPIFLLITQSKLMDNLWSDAQAGKLPDLNLVYLAGFCLIAAFYSRSFLQSVSNQVIRQEQKALKAETKNLKAGQEEIKDNIADLDSKAEGATPPTSAEANFAAAANNDDLKPLLDELSDEEKRVVRALANEDYTRRSLSGIRKEAELNHSETAQALDQLTHRGLVKQSISKVTGSRLYQLEAKGYRLAELLKNS